MSKGITIQEAIDKSESYIKALDDENQNKKEKKIKEICETLNKIIAINIQEIIKKPVTVYFKYERAWAYEKEISEMYKDFTIYFQYHDDYVRIKLADKDWDWNGYGKKETQIKEDANKSIFSKIINKLKQ